MRPPHAPIDFGIRMCQTRSHRLPFATVFLKSRRMSSLFHPNWANFATALHQPMCSARFYDQFLLFVSACAHAHAHTHTKIFPCDTCKLCFIAAPFLTVQSNCNSYYTIFLLLCGHLFFLFFLFLSLPPHKNFINNFVFVKYCSSFYVCCLHFTTMILNIMKNYHTKKKKNRWRIWNRVSML